MRKSILSTLLALFAIVSYAQNGQGLSINGTTDFDNSVLNSLNSIPNFRVGFLSLKGSHVVDIQPNGMHFMFKGSFELDNLSVTMPDGKVFRYTWDSQKNAFVCAQLPEGYISSIPIGSLAISIKNADAMGMDMEIPSGFALPVNRQIDGPSNPYGSISHTQLNKYGLSEDASGNRLYTGTTEEVNKLKSMGITSHLYASGISSNSYRLLDERVKNIREEYSAITANNAVKKNAPTSTGSSSGGSGAKLSTNSASSTNTNNRSSQAKGKEELEAEEAAEAIRLREYERQAAERLRQEKLKQATNPGGYYLEKSGVNDYFNAQMDRLNREAAAKERQEEREWLARQRRERAEQARREREQEQWRKDQLARYAAGREQRINDYKAKGGDANYNAKLNQWRAFAQKEIQQVNQYLKNYKGMPLSFAYPQNNCEFVATIENVQNSEMPNGYKLTLIKNVINLRFQYFEFYRENAYNYENWKGFKDSMYWDIPQATCGNFLDQIAYSLGTDMHIDAYGGSSDIFGTDEALFIGNSYDERLSADGNYSLPIGASPLPISYSDALSEAGIKISKQQITAFTNSHGGDIWSDYQLNPFDWSNGYAFHSESGRYSAGWNYKSKRLAGNQPAIDAEIEKYIAAYNIKREFSLNTTLDEEKMMFFNYNRGAISEAYEHLQRYVVMQFGGYDSLIAGIRKQTETSYKLLESAIAITGVLIEAGDYENAKLLAPATYTKAHQLWGQQLDKKPFNSFTANQYFTPMYIGARELKNRLHFILGEYDQMSLAKTKESIENNIDRTDATFKYVRVTSSRVWAPTPDELEYLKFKFIGSTDPHLDAYALLNLGLDDLAKLNIEQSVKYYSKKDAPAFIGTPLDIEIFQKLVQKFYSNKANKITYKTGLPDLLKRTIDTQSKDGNKHAFLTRFALNSGKTIPLAALDLTENSEWGQVRSKLENIETDKESLSKTFSELQALGKNRILMANEASKNYLSEYVQLGLSIGKFHEVLPALLTFKSLFPEDNSLKLEEELSKLMWPQKENIVAKILETKYNKGNTKRILVYHPTRTFFEEGVRNSEDLKSRLNLYTFAWSKLKVSGVQIPYLYSLD